jgi:SNF2 family DNA or RNA helicase
MNIEQLHGYQLAAIDHILSHTHCGLFLDMGLGKTVSTLTAIDRLIYEELAVNKALVIAPKRVAESVWVQEAAKWSHLSHLRISVVAGNERQRLAALAVKADIYMLGRDNVVWLCGVYGGSMLPFDALIVDESSSFKNAKSLRFKALKLVQPCFKIVVLLTGTPAPNSLIDLWPQIYLLDRGERLGKTITSFRDTFFTPDKRQGHIVYSYNILKGSEEAIHGAIGDICMSMKARDYLDLPERITNIIRIPMPEKVRKEYKAFEREKVLEIFTEDVPITAASAAALSNKLLQYANGAVYDRDKVPHEVHTLKIEALAEIMEQAQGQPVLVAWTYRSDADRIEKHFKKYKPKRLEGDKDVLAWNRGEYEMMLMHPASGGHGLNLQAGGHIIVWFGQIWSPELEQQLNTRLDRQGQPEPVIVNKLVLEGTMDEKVIASQNEKEANQNSLMEAVKHIRDEYK